MSSEAVRYTPHYSAEDYRQWEGDWELWDGIPVCMSPSPTAKHQLAGLNLAMFLKAAIVEDDSCDCLVIYETDWQISDSTVVRPDIAVLCHGLPEQFIDYSPSVITEILSPSTADKDRTAKRQLYASQGVEVYLMADPETNIVEALRLSSGEYQPIDSKDNLLAIEWGEGCQASIHIPAVFAS